MIHRILLLTLVTLLTACGAAEPWFSQLEPIEQQQARVYIYPSINHENITVNDTILVDSVARGKLLSNRFLSFIVTPGRHWLQIRRAGSPIFDDYFTVKADRYVFLRLDSVRMGRTSVSNGRAVYLANTHKLIMEKVTKERALNELPYLRNASKEPS